MSASFINEVICSVVYQINMSDLMMNVQICVTDNTYYTTKVLLLTMITSCGMSDQYFIFYDEFTHKCC
jgi:hypothetical protein